MLLRECCKSCKKELKGKLLLQALCWCFCSLGSASIVKNKLLAVPCLACTNALCINVLRIPYLCALPREELKSVMSSQSCIDFLPPWSQFLAVWMVNSLP